MWVVAGSQEGWTCEGSMLVVLTLKSAASLLASSTPSHLLLCCTLDFTRPEQPPCSRC